MFGLAAEHNALQLNTLGSAFHDRLEYSDTDTVSIKHRVSACYNSDLKTLLRVQRVDTLILCVSDTNMAVEHTARDAHDRDYRVVILTDACAAANQATLASFVLIDYSGYG